MKSVACLSLFSLTWATFVKLSLSDETDTYFVSCPNFRGMRNFSVSEVKGRWYEVGRFGALPEYGGTCVQLEFQESNADDGSFPTQVNHQHLGGWSKWHTTGTSHYRFPEKTADFKVVLDTTLFSSDLMEYTVLETDYKTFGIIWACQQDSSGKHSEGLWIIARTPEWSPENKDNVHIKLRGLGLDPRRLKATANSNC